MMIRSASRNASLRIVRYTSYRTGKPSPAGYCHDYATGVGSPMEFEWDEAKDARTLREGGMVCEEAARFCAKRFWIWQDPRRDYGEDRFRAVGKTDGDILHVAFTWRGNVMRIISVRRASRKEAQLWRSQKLRPMRSRGVPLCAIAPRSRPLPTTTFAAR